MSNFSEQDLQKLAQHLADLLILALQDAPLSDFKPTNSRQIYSNKQWFKTKEAYKLLDLKSAEQLRNMRRAGRFREGKDYRFISCSPSTLRPTYQWNVPNCLEQLKLPLRKIKGK